MNRQTLTLATALGCAISLYLLGTELEQARNATPPTSAPSKQSETAPKQDESDDEDQPSVEQPANEPETIDTAPQETPLKVTFHAPFPDRVHLFQAPKRQGSGNASTVGKSESAVELLGFVNVGSPRAVLSIDGMVSPLAEGGQQFGIEVISIQPPTVVLQRGRQRWQATLEN